MINKLFECIVFELFNSTVFFECVNIYIFLEKQLNMVDF